MMVPLVWWTVLGSAGVAVHPLGNTSGVVGSRDGEEGVRGLARLGLLYRDWFSYGYCGETGLVTVVWAD